MSRARIPLFPLGIVVLPGEPIPLHIFEPRYREMTQHCGETRSPFGVVLADSGNIALTGCSALIVKILKEYPDGRSDILVVGQHPFQIIGTHEEKSYIEADVEYLENDMGGIDPKISARLRKLFEECHRILYQREAPAFESEEDASLSYYVASELPFELPIRQALLEQRSEAQRQHRLVKHLEDWKPRLAKRNQIREKAGGNGHKVN
jgi:ATP-dependent Lon protease